jgi:hypothetical protein
MWRSLIHLDLSFVQRDKNGSFCILLHTYSNLSQHHLLNMHSFLPLDSFNFSVKDQVTIGVGLILGLQFYSIDLPACLYINTMQVFITIPLKYSLRSGNMIPPEVLLLLRIVFAILGFCYFRFANCSF